MTTTATRTAETPARIRSGSVLAWLCQAGITEERALAHLRDGWVLIDGAVVTDPATPLPASSRVELRNFTPHALYV